MPSPAPKQQETSRETGLGLKVTTTRFHYDTAFDGLNYAPQNPTRNMENGAWLSDYVLGSLAVSIEIGLQNALVCCRYFW